LAASAVFADQMGDGPRGYDHMMWGGGSGMFGGLMMLVFWGVVIALAFIAARWFTDRRSGGGRSDAMEILKERFAKGEIDEDKFEKRKTALEN
jgi:putative membrane protein